MTSTHLFAGIVATIIYFFVDKMLSSWGVGESSLGAKVVKTLVLAVCTGILALVIVAGITGHNPLW